MLHYQHFITNNFYVEQFEQDYINHLIPQKHFRKITVMA